MTVCTEEDGTIVVVTEEAAELIVDGCQQGPPGASGVGVNTPAVTIATTATAAVDLVPVVGNEALYWIVTGTDTVGDKRSAVVFAHWDASNNTYRVVSNNFGQFANWTVLVTISAGNVELRITNNHTLSIDVRTVRFRVCTSC